MEGLNMRKPNNDYLNHHHSTFPGFPPEPVTNYWAYPKALNGWWHALTPWEQKVLDYILRHTWGYKKVADAISLSQFIRGITKRDGTVVDKGTGIKDPRTIRKALKGLVNKGFIERIDQIGAEPIFELKINPSQEMSPLTSNDTPPPTQNDITHPYQDVSSTINDLSIKDNNNNKGVQKEEFIVLSNNKQEKKFSSIKEITQIELDLISEEYQVPSSFVVSKFDDLQNYCLSKGRTYKNYLAALRNFVKNDAIKLRKEVALHESKRGIDLSHLK